MDTVQYRIQPDSRKQNS